MTQKLTADDFFTGLFASLKLRGVQTFSLRNDKFDSVLAFVFQKLTKLSSEKSIDVRFRIRLHPIHGDSATVRDSITNAAQRDLISLDNPEYQDMRIKIGKQDADKMLSTIPGGKELFDILSEEFLARSDCHQLQNS